MHFLWCQDPIHGPEFVVALDDHSIHLNRQREFKYLKAKFRKADYK